MTEDKNGLAKDQNGFDLVYDSRDNLYGEAFDSPGGVAQRWEQKDNGPIVVRVYIDSTLPSHLVPGEEEPRESEGVYGFYVYEAFNAIRNWAFVKQREVYTKILTYARKEYGPSAAAKSGKTNIKDVHLAYGKFEAHAWVPTVKAKRNKKNGTPGIALGAMFGADLYTTFIDDSLVDHCSDEHLLPPMGGQVDDHLWLAGPAPVVA